jgi:polyhydroxyalkanoate synthase
VERWTLDESALPQRLFEEVVEHLYREDRFLRGTLQIGDKYAKPDRVTAPLLSVVDRRCVIAPRAAVIPFHQAVRSTDKRLLWYDGDTGVAFQHVGMLVGRNAHQRLWPAIIRWVQAHTGRA